MLVLLLGDLNIPFSTNDLPLKFKKLLVPGKIQHILFTGNLTCPETFEYLRTICPDISLVCGDMDTPKPNIPQTRVLTFGNNIKIGLLHGHQLAPISTYPLKAREMDVDVLVCGMGDGFDAKEIDGRFYVFPGSATGAYSSKMPRLNSSALNKPSDHNVPSFVLMDIQDITIVFYIYKLIENEVKVEKMDFVKKIFD